MPRTTSKQNLLQLSRFDNSQNVKMTGRGGSLDPQMVAARATVSRFRNCENVANDAPLSSPGE
jgi:hypothetical protein